MHDLQILRFRLGHHLRIDVLDINTHKKNLIIKISSITAGIFMGYKAMNWYKQPPIYHQEKFSENFAYGFRDGLHFVNKMEGVFVGVLITGCILGVAHLIFNSMRNNRN